HPRLHGPGPGRSRHRCGDPGGHQGRPRAARPPRRQDLHRLARPMPRPPAPWDAIYDSLFLHAQQQVFAGNQVGPSGYTTLEDLLTNHLAWFGLNLVQQMGSSNAPIVQAINAFTDAAANNVIAQTRAKGDQLIGNLNAAFAALTATVDGDFNALSKQIA